MNPADDVPSAKANGDGRIDVETDERERRLNGAIRELIEARESGAEPDRQDWLARYPEFQQELTAYLETDDQLHWLVHTVVPAEPASGVRFGPYRIVHVIGKGGMGVVYEVEESGTSRRLALKVLPTCGLPDPENRTRFRREAESLTLLDHPNIVPILAFHEIGGIPAIVMPLIEGMDLRTIRRQLERAYKGVARRDCELGAGEPQSHLVANPDKPEDEVRLGGTSPPWRAIALIGLQAARALAHAHEHGILHRDVKPSNLVLDLRGSVLLTDFGLADPAGPGQADLTATGDVVGTLRYLAPERLHGWRDPRSDIYSLGLTLYELLVARPAFGLVDRSRLLRAIELESPPRPRKSRRDIPKDLETIVLKAIQKEPKDRYVSANALADDLRRFLYGQPIEARPIGVPERAWKWVRLNKAKAAALGLVSGCLVAIVAGGFLYEMKRREAAEARAGFALVEREAAEARASAVQAQRDAAQAAQREGEFQTHLLRLQNIGSRQKEGGWRKEAEELVGKALKIRANGLLRDFVLPTFAGLDVRPGWTTAEFGGSSVAFDAGGGRLLVGGLEPGQGRDLRAKLIDLTTNQIQFSSQTGTGPVAFDRDGRPLQLVTSPKDELLVWDVGLDQAVTRIDTSGPGKPSRLAISEGGQFIAASYDGGGDKAAGVVRAWEVATGRRLFEAPRPTAVLAFSPDGGLLASGDIEGWVEVHRLADGSRLARFRDQNRKIYCLCFARDPWRDAQGEHGWLLAEGGPGGTVVIWDVKRQNPRAKCHGSPYFVTTLAFSPDASILASTGRLLVTLWDTSSGQPILHAGCPDFARAVTFSSDGAALAISSKKEFRPDKVQVLEIENGRGIRVLRGLSTPVVGFLVLPRRRLLVAWGQDYRVGLWELETGNLVYVREAPEQFESYSLHPVVNREETQLALVGGRVAELWEVDSGRTLRHWRLPDGLMDSLAFPSSHELILSRVESLDGKRHPYGNRDPANLNVFRLRNLLAPPEKQILRNISGFEGRMLQVWLDPDGGKLTVLGSSSFGEDSPLKLAVIDVHSGQSLWSRAMDSRVEVLAEPGGTIIAWRVPEQDGMTLLDSSTGKDVGSWKPRSIVSRRGPRGLFLTNLDSLHATPLGQQGFCVRRGEGEVLFNFSSGPSWTNPGVEFTGDARHLIWGNPDGTVAVCELEEVRKRLNRCGLGWPEARGSKPEERH